MPLPQVARQHNYLCKKKKKKDGVIKKKKANNLYKNNHNDCLGEESVQKKIFFLPHCIEESFSQYCHQRSNVNISEYI